MDHITFRMPMFVNTVSVNFYKLFQNSSLTTRTFDCKSSRVMVMAINLAVMFVIRILRTEYGRASRAGKVLNVILFIKSRNIGASKGTTALFTDKIQPSEIISFT